MVREITLDTVNTLSNLLVSDAVITLRKRMVSPKDAVTDFVGARTYSKVIRMRLLIMGSI